MNMSAQLGRVALALALAGALGAAGQAAQITVMVNGARLAFDQPPIERSGRILVPLRGIFERLGASVVYENGTITATAGPRTIALTVGSRMVLVNGASQELDVPAQIDGGRALVPLRFVSQALGASVAYDASTKSIAITAVPTAPPVLITPPPSPVAIKLVGIRPAAKSNVPQKRVTIAAQFSQPVNPNSVHFFLDDRDLTSDAYISDTSFSYDPTYDLPAGAHTVRIAGRVRNGAPFDTSWSFKRIDALAAHAYFSVFSPRNTSAVAPLFSLYGRANPNASVHVVTSSWVFHGSFRMNNLPSRFDTRADAAGNFSAQIAVPGTPGTNLSVSVTVTTPDGSSTLQRVYHYHV